MCLQSSYCSDRDPAKVQVALTNDLERIAVWIEANGLTLNVAKTRLTQENCPLPLRGVDIEESTAIKYLGVTIDLASIPGRVDSKNNTADANFVLLKKNRPGNEATIDHARSQVKTHTNKYKKQNTSCPSNH